ncbi:MAG: nitroreductase family protein, partial [Actinobacteria bacterium]|nr:nitroreductase family protein [Actinomycetota bacterium]
RFRADPVPEEVVRKLVDAARYAPSSCNLQLWDFVVVRDPAVKARLAEETRYVDLAPVAMFVSYGNNYTLENHAWVQSAAAAIQNMMLLAQGLGIGSCWVDTLGNVDRLRRILGLPRERQILALILFGYPEIIPKAPRRRDIDVLLHWDRYHGSLNWPSTDDPEAWTLEQIRDFQMAKIRNGARYDKPIPSERDAVLAALRAFVPAGRHRWLDVLPLTGLYTEYIATLYPEAALTFTEMTEQVVEFVRERSPRDLAAQAYPAEFYGDEGRYDVTSCIFRLESLPRGERRKLLTELRRRIAPDGRLFVAFVNRRSYYAALRWARARAGHAGVEYALAPDPSLGPYRGALPGELQADLRATGWKVRRTRRAFAIPPADEIGFRAGRKGRKVELAGRVLTRLGQAAKFAEPLLAPLARLHFWDVAPAPSPPPSPQ